MNALAYRERPANGDPAGLLVLLVLAINVVGDGLRDAFDPNAGGRVSRT